MNAQSTPSRAFTVGEAAHALCVLEFSSTIDVPTVDLLIRDRLGNPVTAPTRFTSAKGLGPFAPGERREVSFAFQLNLRPDRYSLSVIVHSGRDHLSDKYD